MHSEPAPAGKPLLDSSLLVAMMLPSAAVTLATGMFTVALPALRADFQLSVSSLAWTVAANLYPQVVLVVLFGAAADLTGRKRLLLFGVTTFFAGCWLAALSPDFVWLLAGRLLQGCGAAVLFSLPLAIVADLISAPSRGVALGLWNAAASLASVLGFLLGGFMVDRLGWRTVFAPSVFVSAVGAGAIWFILPSSAGRGTLRSLDWPGVAALAVATSTGLLAISGSVALPPPFSSRPALAGIALLSLVAFVGLERVRSHPLIALSIFQRPGFLTATAVASLRGFAQAGYLFLSPLLLGEVQGKSASEIGATMLLSQVALAVAVPLGGMWADAWGVRRPACLGLLLMATGLAGLGQVQADWPTVSVASGLALAGFGAGLAVASFNKSATDAFDPGRRASSAGVYSMLVNTGFAMSPPIVGGYLAGRLAEGPLFGQAAAFAEAFALASVAALLAALLALLLREP